MTFHITIKHERKNIRLLIEKISSSREQEQYKVVARNQSFVLQSNRPFLIMKGLKTFPITWKVVEGGYHNKYLLDQITAAIEWYEKGSGIMQRLFEGASSISKSGISLKLQRCVAIGLGSIIHKKLKRIVLTTIQNV